MTDHQTLDGTQDFSSISEDVFEPIGLHNALCNEDFEHAVPLPLVAQSFVQSTPVAPAVHARYDTFQGERLISLQELFDQIAFEGITTDDEFLDGQARNFDMSPYPRIVELPPTPLAECEFNPKVQEASLVEDFDQYSDSQEHDEFAVTFHYRGLAHHEDEEPLSSSYDPGAAETAQLRSSEWTVEQQSASEHGLMCQECGHMDDSQSAPRYTSTTPAKGVRFQEVDELYPCVARGSRDFEQSTADDWPCLAGTKNLCYLRYPGDRLSSETAHANRRTVDDISPRYVRHECESTCLHGQQDYAEFVAADEIPNNSPDSIRQSILVGPTDSTSFNPATPYPKTFNKLSNIDLHIRIAQVLDELRILNLALAKRNQNEAEDDISEEESSPLSAWLRPKDSFYLSCAGAAQV